jgi:hypothetical protein
MPTTALMFILICICALIPYKRCRYDKGIYNTRTTNYGIFCIVAGTHIGGKARGKETARKTRCWWVVNIITDHGEVGWCDVDWIGLAQDRNKWRALVNSVPNLRVP